MCFVIYPKTFIDDERINVGIPAFEAALKAASVDYRMFMYENTAHAFFNEFAEPKGFLIRTLKHFEVVAVAAPHVADRAGRLGKYLKSAGGFRHDSSGSAVDSCSGRISDSQERINRSTIIPAKTRRRLYRYRLRDSAP